MYCVPPRGAGGRLCDGDGTFAGHREKVSQMCQLCQGSQRGDIKSRGERINEFTGLSLDPRNLLLHESVLRETVLATEDNPCINPLAFCAEAQLLLSFHTCVSKFQIDTRVSLA